MGAGPTAGQVRYHMTKAKAIAKAYNEKTGEDFIPRLQRASNGEAAILYYSDKLAKVDYNKSYVYSLPDYRKASQKANA